MQKEKKQQGFLSCLLQYASGSRGRLWASVILSVISVSSGIVPYYCFYRVIDGFIRGAADGSMIFGWSLRAFLACLVKVVCFGLSTGLSHYAAYHILEQLRLRVADRFLHAPLGVVTDHSIGEIKNLIVDKIEEIEPPLAHMIPEGTGHLVLPVLSFGALWLVDWRVALASLVTLPLSMVCMVLTFQISGKNFDKYNDSNARMNSMIVEYIEGIEVIKAFGRSGTSYEKYAQAIHDYKTFVVKWMSSTWIPFKLAFALFPATLLGTLPASLWLASEGVITAAQTALCAMLSMSMVTSLAKLEVFLNSMKQIQMTVEELQEYLDMPELPEPKEPAAPDMPESPKLKEPAAPDGCDVELDNVCFSYTGNPQDEVLHDISLKLPAGSFTALVGPSGGGKSTVAKLISRFWDVTGGSIRIGGTDISRMPLSQLSGLVSFVTQENFLFRCSLKENIRLGNPGASDEEVYAAARAAQCEEFIQKLPQGYDTPAGEAGKRLSGGEKQRIAIARMILKNAPVVILDEATAFMDPENEDKLQRSIAELTRGGNACGGERSPGKTLLVIAHRLSTIKNADRIVVLKEGQILAQGTQEQLLSGCPLYAQMWKAHTGAKSWGVRADAKKEGLRADEKIRKKEDGNNV